MTTTTVAWLLPHLIAHVAGRGCDTAPIRKLPGLQGQNLRDPDLRIADAAAVDAWRLAVEITGDDALGLHMAQAVQKGALDLLEYAFRSSTTLEAGLEQLARYGRAMSDRAAARLVWEGETLAVTWDGNVQRQRVDFALAFVVRLVREATKKALAPIEVRFAYSAPRRLSEYRTYFRSRIVHDTTVNQVLFARQDLLRPFVSADAALAGMTGRRLEKMLRQLPKRSDSTAVRGRRVLLGLLARGKATAKVVGRELGMSERTLHRRLHDEGTSFRRVLDDVRRDVATALLDDQRIAIAEIAFILGYSEPAAFTRSFRRWTGQSPQAARHALRPA
jgi:AraC-like DNA-binding protein